MSLKNETLTLVLTFLVTGGLVGGGFWWLTQKAGLDPGRLFRGGNDPTTQNSPGFPAAPNTSSPTGTHFASVPNVPSGLFNYGGSTSWAPIRQRVDSVIQAERPEFRLRYVQPANASPGSGAGIRMLIRDELAFVQSSRPVSNQEYQQAQQRGTQLKQIPVAIDGLAVAVNPDLAISGLTLAQLKDIYQGRIQNWSQVGGPNLPIQPFTRPIAAGGTIELFVEEILQGAKFGANVQTVSTTTEALRRLAATPGGVYFASAPEVVPQCTIKPIPVGRTAGNWVPPYQVPLVAASQCPNQRNQLNIQAFQNGQYPLTRNLYVVVKQNGQIEAQAGEAYANLLRTQQGQELISQSGFVRLY